MTFADWSMDGRFLSFASTDLSGGILYALPLGGNGEHTPIEIARSKSQVTGPRPSPDSRVLSYASNQSGKNEVYVWPFDPSAGVGAAPTGGPWQVSDDGLQLGQGPVFWREDGREMYYVAADSGVMAVKVSTAPTFEFGKPTLLFRPPESVAVTQWLVGVSRDGQRVAIAVPHAPTLQQLTVFDRKENMLRKVGEPGRYQQPMLSPDGKRVAVVRIVPQTGNEDIWTFDVASGQGTPVTRDVFSAESPVWSPDGREVAYVSRRGSYSNIYRKSWNGTGDEEQLFQYTPGVGMQLTDWSADGRLLVFQDDCAGVLYVVPLGGVQSALERKPLEWLRDEYNVGQARLSPDSRFMAYLSEDREAAKNPAVPIF